MTTSDYWLTLALLTAAAGAVLLALKPHVAPPIQEERPEMKPLAWHPKPYYTVNLGNITDEQFMGFLGMLGIARKQRSSGAWLCCHAGCERVHETHEGAEFCSMTQPEIYASTRLSN